MQKPTKKHRACGTSSVVVESLEPRRHLSTAKPKFALYESDFSGPGIPYFTRAWWSAPDMANSAGTIDASQQKVTSLANIARNGGIAPWTHKPVSAGSFTFLDFEVDGNRDPLYYKKRLAWFHQAAPNVKVSIDGINFGLDGLNRNDVANASPAVIAKIKAQLQAQAPMIESMSVIPICCYMLSPTSADVNRDLTFIQTYSSILRQMFPTKGIIAWASGAYHTSWNPEHAVFSDSVTQKYIQTITKTCDGMLVWGAHEDNAKLEKMAAQMTGYVPAPAPAPAPKPISITGSLFSNHTIPPKPQDMMPLA